ncbi:clasp N terminal-domain-containing protein [Dipodascopsis uninucleata]
MSLQDALSLHKQLEQRDLTADKLINFLNYLRHEFKHQAVEPKAIEVYVDSLVKGSFRSHIKISQYSFACLCHLVKRIYFQDQPKLRRYANAIVPVLIEKLAEHNKIHDIARKALADYWRATSLDVERCLRKYGFLSDRAKVREQTLRFLCTLQASEVKFTIRTLLFDVVSALRDVNRDVQEACKSCLIELYKSATPQALSDLRSEMYSQDIAPNIISNILSSVGAESLTECENHTMHIIPITPSISTVPGPAMNSAASTVLNLNNSHILSMPQVPSKMVSVSHGAIRNVAAAAPSAATSMSVIAASGNSLGSFQKRTPLAPISIRPQGENRTSSTSLAAGPEISQTAEEYIRSVPGTSIEEMNPFYVNSSRELESIMEQMLPSFDGKETEDNWSQRQKNVINLRELIRGNAYADYAITFITCLRGLVEGINKAVSSLRTTLSGHACKCIMDLAHIAKNGIDPFVDVFMSSLLKLCGSTKKIAAQTANAAIVVLIVNTSFQPRPIHLTAAACRDKNAQARLYGSGWLRLILILHCGQKSVMDSFNCGEVFESCIKSGISDANPKVRENMRQTFWEFQSIWPQKANIIMKNLDSVAKKALEKVNPRSTLSVQEPKKRSIMSEMKSMRLAEVKKNAAISSGKHE